MLCGAGAVVRASVDLPVIIADAMDLAWCRDVGKRHDCVIAHAATRVRLALASPAFSDSHPDGRPVRLGVGDVQRLGPQDASFLYLETPTNLMHVSAVMIFDPSDVPGGHSFERVKEFIAGRLHLVPQFRRRQSMHLGFRRCSY